MTRDEQRQAWRVYAAAVSAHDSMVLNQCTQWADLMLKEERKRFDQSDHSGDVNEKVEPRPWVGLTDAELGVLLADSITEPVVVVVRRIEKMLREKNGGTR
jgi:hypothetical protein